MVFENFSLTQNTVERVLKKLKYSNIYGNMEFTKDIIVSNMKKERKNIMKKKFLVPVVAAILLLSNCMTAFAEEYYPDEGLKPVVDKPSPYEDAILEPYYFNKMLSVNQKSPDFYSQISAPGRKNPTRAVMTYIDDGDAENYSYKYEYDARGNLASVTELFDDGSIYEIIQYAYDAKDRVVSETSTNVWRGYSSTTKYTYDAKGNLLSEVCPPDENYGEWSNKYTYDARGNLLTWVFNASGDVTKYSYKRDKKGNLLTYSCDNGVEMDKHALTYDAKGNLATDIVSYNYNPEAYTKHQYTYDAQGNLLVHDCIMDAGDGLYETFQYTYDASGNVLTHTRYISKYDQQVTDQLTYDAAGRLLTHVHESVPLSASLTVVPFYSVAQYTYDANGNLLTYTCDARQGQDKHKYWTRTKQYTYDALGNLVTYTSTENAYASSGARGSSYVETEKWQYFYE